MPDPRPHSGESFTTSTEGYEIPLLKNLQSTAMGAMGYRNPAYEPTTPGSMSAGPSFISLTEPESRPAPENQGQNVYTKVRTTNPASAQVKIGGVKIKPNAPKPPLKPEVVSLSSSPASARRANSPEVQAPVSYENYKPG